jgi:WD40 repeat protein
LRVDNPAKEWSLPPPKYSVAALSLGAEVRRLATVGRNRSVSIWDIASSQRVIVVPDATNSRTSELPGTSAVLFDPSGTRLALTVDDPKDTSRRDTTIFDVANGQELLAIQGSTAPLAFSADGRLLAAIPEPDASEAHVHETVGGRLLARLRGHSGPIRALAFSPDGARIASASHDGTLKIWEAATGRELLTLPGSAGPPDHLRFGADGSQLIAADDQGTVRIWDAQVPGQSRKRSVQSDSHQSTNNR